jgi:hypothetical protein
LLTTASGSSPRLSRASEMVFTASSRARSARRTVGRGLPFAAISSASAPSAYSRLATRTSATRLAARCNALTRADLSGKLGAFRQMRCEIMTA